MAIFFCFFDFLELLDFYFSDIFRDFFVLGDNPDAYFLIFVGEIESFDFPWRIPGVCYLSLCGDPTGEKYWLSSADLWFDSGIDTRLF